MQSLKLTAVTTSQKHNLKVAGGAIIDITLVYVV